MDLWDVLPNEWYTKPPPRVDLSRSSPCIDYPIRLAKFWNMIDDPRDPF
jgi:hypothetical protein